MDHIQSIVAKFGVLLSYQDVKLLEDVQRRATKLIKEVNGMKYYFRLQKLGLSHQETRRILSDVIETYKILNGLYNIDEDLFFLYKGYWWEKVTQYEVIQEKMQTRY